jgi:hypothetical protein
VTRAISAVPSADPRRTHPKFLPLLIALSLLAPAAVRGAEAPKQRASEDPMWLLRHHQPMERMQDAPLPTPSQPAGPAHVTGSTVTFGSFTSIQVNVNGLGNDIAGDAANEPSLVVDPNNHNLMAIGWRQFDNVASNFRQAGFGYTTNGGLTWTAGKINAGVFRSDPVLDTDGNGNFFYNSLKQDFTMDVFKSATGGSTWGAGVNAFGGDKQWMVFDRDLDNAYEAWSIAASPYLPNTFDRSVDDAATFNSPSTMPFAPIWGTLATASDHALYVAGWATQGDSVFTGDFRVDRSTDASAHTAGAPTFTSAIADLGGFVNTGGPNPAGLLGQAWVAVDHSASGRNGWVYVLSSVETDTDPMDVHFTRSTDGGQTWIPPVRVNDDATGTRAFQWFGTMSVSPSGRIDAVWNDTRGSTDSTISALYYSYSLTAGGTWSPNQQVSPVWNSTIGWPNQQKIGDYYQTVSDDGGVDVAYAATFNGGQNVWYLRIPNTANPTGVGKPVATRPRLIENYPNPFAGETTVRFDAPEPGARVRVEVFDLTGHRVATLVDEFRTGAGQIARWDGKSADGHQSPAGVYLCRMQVNGQTDTRKLLRVK